MNDFLRSIEAGNADEISEKDLKDAGISSAALKKQLKKISKGMFG